MQGGFLPVLERIAVGAVAITEQAIASGGADLTFVQWRVLMIVGARTEGATIGEIANRIGARSSPTSRLISRLKRRGVVSAQNDPRDARVKRVRLTAAGALLRARVLGARREQLRAISTSLQVTPATGGLLEAVADEFERFA